MVCDPNSRDTDVIYLYKKYLHGKPQTIKCNMRNIIKGNYFSISQSHISNVIMKPILNGKQLRTKLIDIEISILNWEKREVVWIQDPVLNIDVMFLVIVYIYFRRIYQCLRSSAQGMLG